MNKEEHDKLHELELDAARYRVLRECPGGFTSQVENGKFCMSLDFICTEEILLKGNGTPTMTLDDFADALLTMSEEEK